MLNLDLIKMNRNNRKGKRRILIQTVAVLAVVFSNILAVSNVQAGTESSVDSNNVTLEVNNNKPIEIAYN